MDYSKRNYYLVTISSSAYDMRLRFYNIAAPSLKIHSPYNHAKSNPGYDGRATKNFGYGFWQMMLSCKKEDSEALEYEFRKAERNDKDESYFLKLTKELCEQ